MGVDHTTCPLAVDVYSEKVLLREIFGKSTGATAIIFLNQVECPLYKEKNANPRLFSPGAVKGIKPQILHCVQNGPWTNLK